jgi:hypothetical protein
MKVKIISAKEGYWYENIIGDIIDIDYDISKLTTNSSHFKVIDRNDRHHTYYVHKDDIQLLREDKLKRILNEI